MKGNVLITGGAGFIGSHLADRLLREGYSVRALDNMIPQVHGDSKRPDYLADDVELQIGDVRDPEAVRKALDGIDFVYHFAAGVGVGQSMYEVAKYTDINNLGTAVLLEALIEKPVQKLVVASSMSLYGEGLYKNSKGEAVTTGDRKLEDLKRGEWEPLEEDGKTRLNPVPTPESKPAALTSVYALSKFDQERLCMMIGKAYNIPAVALRFFNVFGTRQSLSNPYTGVLAIFSSRLLNDNPPLVYEDGNQKRDFVSALDIAQGCQLALETPEANDMAINLGSGNSYSVLDVARIAGKALGKSHIEPQVAGKYRIGDIRHCFADISLAQRVLGYKPTVRLDEGIVEIAEWMNQQKPTDMVEKASAELAARGLTV